jgi:hypothetical protein
MAKVLLVGEMTEKNQKLSFAHSFSADVLARFDSDGEADAGLCKFGHLKRAKTSSPLA